jgi:hypothetical protein
MVVGGPIASLFDIDGSLPFIQPPLFLAKLLIDLSDALSGKRTILILSALFFHAHGIISAA